MSLIAKKSEGKFDLIPEMTVQGVVFAVYDCGEQPDNFHPGETKHKIRLGIELNEIYQTGEYAGSRMTRYPEFTLSLSDKANLLPVIESILGRALTNEEKEGFDLENLIGYNLQDQIIHKISDTGKEYAIDKISALMKNVPSLLPILAPDYIPNFIKEIQLKADIVINDSVSPKINPVFEEAKIKIKKLIDEGKLTGQDFNNTIVAITKINGSKLSECSDQQIIEILNKIDDFINKKSLF